MDPRETQKWGVAPYLLHEDLLLLLHPGVRHDPETPQLLIEHLKGHGEVLTEHIGQVTEEFEAGISEVEIFKRDVAWLEETDVVVAEVTGPSLGVGYEIGIAETFGKSILCLYEEGEKKISAMILGNDGLTLRGYRNISEAYAYIDEFLSLLKPS